MQVSLRELNRIGAETLVLNETVELEGLEREVRQLVRFEPLRVQVAVSRNDHRYHVKGELETTATVVCSKCLTQFDVPLHTEWEAWLTEHPAYAEETEEREVQLIESDPVDLTPYIREAMLFTLPFVPVCREDCKGLCPKCGVNRNEVTCTCDTERIDPRLAALQDWFNHHHEKD